MGVVVDGSKSTTGEAASHTGTWPPLAVPPQGGRFASAVAQVAVLALVVVLAGTACSDDAVPDGDPLTYGNMPLTGIVIDGAALGSLQMVMEDGFIVECMRREGFLYDPPRREPTTDPMIERPELTVERARQLGYRVPEFDVVDTDPELRAYLDSLGEQGRREWETAFFGSGKNMISIEVSSGRLSTPADGCISEARAMIAGDVENALEWQAIFDELGGLRSEALDRTDSDDDVQRAYDEWRSCMRSEGYQVDTIDDAFSLATEVPRAQDGDTDGAEPPADDADVAAEDGPASEREIEIAVADATCRDTSGYRAIYAERLSVYENEVLAANEQILFAWQDVRAQMREAFSDLIATYGFDDDEDPSQP